MNFDGLAASYWELQASRVEDLRKRISERAPAPNGRLIPDDETLAIGAGRRMPLTILFTDICGFSSRVSLTPEEQEMNLRMLNLYFTEMIRITEDFGGTVEKNTGDGLMAYFEDSAEYAKDNATKRAVACSLTMFAANEHLIAPVLRASNLPTIEFRASIEHGPVTVARIGAPRRFSANVAIGNAANFASKMLAHLKANELGMGQAAVTRLPTYWQQQFVSLSDIVTGWVYASNDLPYPLYRYIGRWTRTV